MAPQPALTSGPFLKLVYGNTVEVLEESPETLALLLPGDSCWAIADTLKGNVPASGQELVWEVAVEDDAGTEEPSKDWDTDRELVDKVYVERLDVRQRPERGWDERGERTEEEEGEE